MTAMPAPAPAPLFLPRELAPGIFWLGHCMKRLLASGASLHLYNCGYLVAGEKHSAFVETGMTCDALVVMEQAEQLLAERGLPEPRYIFTTHSEMAHSGGIGRLMERFPDTTVHGDISDFHLVFPQYVDRVHWAEPGERFDLGGTEIVVCESVFRDFVHSRWFFDTKRRALFPGDGFAYAHHHEEGACGHIAEEVPEMDISGEMAFFAEVAFHWTQYVDIEPFIARLRKVMFEELDVQLVAPTHGLPIADPRATMPTVEAGMRTMRAH
jgi:flavorubredoxin